MVVTRVAKTIYCTQCIDQCVSVGLHFYKCFPLQPTQMQERSAFVFEGYNVLEAMPQWVTDRASAT